VLHAATLAPTAVSPGLIISIVGSNLGPTTGVVAQPGAGQTIGTSLGGVRVRFDGIESPLLFVRNDQINAVVPYELHGRLTTRMEVEVSGRTSGPLELRVVPSAPGVFTIDASGRGRVAALNQDYTVNSPDNPARRGTVIQIFATGEGQTEPPGITGRITTPSDLKRPILPVTARIDGRTVQVLYAGSAPAAIAGAFQVNLFIPEDQEFNDYANLELTVGGVPIQGGVTVSTR
jgi:uncharacterized protein (TIGR03437 family)